MNLDQVPTRLTTFNTFNSIFLLQFIVFKEEVDGSVLAKSNKLLGLTCSRVQHQEMTHDVKILSFEEVSKHNQKTDCWLILFGKVYDVTKFLDDHPGGEEVLLFATEKDATEDFEDTGHSQNARDMMKDYYIGEFDTNSMSQNNSATPTSNSTTASKSSKQPPESSSTNMLAFVLPLLILVFAYLYFFAKKEVVINQP